MRVLGAAGDPSDVAAILARSATIRRPEVRVAVAFALTRMGEPARRGARWQPTSHAWRRPRRRRDRVLAALMLRECDPEARQSTAAPLGVAPRRCRSPTWSCAALAAVRWPEDADLLPAAARPHPRPAHRRGRRRRRWSGPGRPRCAVVDEGLSSAELDRRVQELFVRVARDVGGPSRRRGAARPHRAPRPRHRAGGDARARRASGPPTRGRRRRRTHGSSRSCRATSSTPRTCSAPSSRFDDEPSADPAARRVARRARPAAPAGHRGAVDATRHRRPRPRRVPARPARRALPRAGHRVAGRDPDRRGARRWSPLLEPNLSPARAPAPPQPLLPARVR